MERPSSKEDCFSNIGCSKHPGEPVHRYCRTCTELLCFSCVVNAGGAGGGHRGHDIIPYKNYVKEKEREAQKLLNRFNALRSRAEHFSRLLIRYKEEFDASYRESEENLDSFEVVRKSMKTWKNNLLEDLDGKKAEQVKIINEAISSTNRGVLRKDVAVRLPKVTVCVPLHKRMCETILELVPRSHAEFSRGSSDYGPRKKSSFRLKPSADDMASLQSVRSSVFSPISRPFSVTSEEFPYYDEVGSISSSVTDSMMLGETAYTRKTKLPLKQPSSSNPPPPLTLPSTPDSKMHNRPKLATPVKKNDSQKELVIATVPSTLPEYPSNDSDCSDEENLFSSLPSNQSHFGPPASVASTVRSDNIPTATEAQPMLQECVTDSKQELEGDAGTNEEAVEEEEVEDEAVEEEEVEEEEAEEEEVEEEEVEEDGSEGKVDPPAIPTIAVDDTEVSTEQDNDEQNISQEENNNEEDYTEPECINEKPPTPSQSDVNPDDNYEAPQTVIPPSPPPRNPVHRSESAVSGEIYVSPNSVRPKPQPSEESQYLILKGIQLKAQSLMPPPLPPPRSGSQKKSIYSSTVVSPISECSSLHPLAMPKSPISHTDSYDTLMPEASTTDSEYEVIYDDIDSTQMTERREERKDSELPYSKPYEGRRARSLALSYQPLTHETSSNAVPYEIPEPQPHQNPSPVTAPRQLVIPPEQVIMASCFADNPSENVCLYDLCITLDGYMVFSDKSNYCLRCMLGTSEGAKTITKRFKDDIQPRSVAFDNCDHRIIMSTSQGLYQVKCSSHFSNMKEKRLSKDMIPLSLTCSTVPVAKKKSQSLMYVTLWPSNGESCAYRFDTNGQFESRISSPDISNKKPHGIDYMKEYLVVTCLRDGTLAKISHRGDSLWDSSVDARRPGILKHPFGVAILPRTEYIAVTEMQGHRVSIFSDKGKLILRLGEKGTERGKFDSPRGIAVRMAKELVVVDCGNKRVQIFSLSSLSLPTFRSSSFNSGTVAGYTSVGPAESVTYYKRPTMFQPQLHHE